MAKEEWIQDQSTKEEECSLNEDIPNFLASVCIPIGSLIHVCRGKSFQKYPHVAKSPTKANKKNLKKCTKNLLLLARCYILISCELCPMSTCKGQYVGSYSLMCMKARFYLERLLRFWNTSELGGSQGFNNCAIFDHGLQRTYESWH